MKMCIRDRVTVLAAVGGASWIVLGQASTDPSLWQHRNLGKAFYENPTTHGEAVAELKEALALAPKSPRDLSLIHISEAVYRGRSCRIGAPRAGPQGFLSRLRQGILQPN